tara:strand:- start:1968 stop:2453 length:486 start_codon:yes stop_codon:yes gene_type:complete
MNDLENLYNKNRRRYVNMMSSILRQDRAAAEDVVQEAFCRAIKFYHSFDPKRGKLSSWFNRILFNSLRDVQKEMRWQTTSVVDGLSVETLFTEVELTNNPALSNLISKAIDKQTNENHRRVLELFFIFGYTSTEISQIEEKVSVSNVTTVVNRFRVELVGE